jgi:hypothetical protein
MKALTIRQPWASLFALNVKHMETRSWDTKVRGPVAIHAGLAMPCRVGERIQIGPFEVERDQSGLLLRGATLSWPYRLPMGAVVAIGDLFQTRSTTNSEHSPDDLERSLGDHSRGRFAWSISSISPVLGWMPAKGRQGFWNWDMPDGVNERLRYPISAERAS